MPDCVFCKIIAGQAPGEIVYRDQWVTAFRDIRPLAPTHILIVPNKHLPSVNEVQAEDEPVLGRLFTVARQLAEQEGIAQSGYRLIVNTGPHSGQMVFHLHMHLLGGQRMRFPMG
jgi:histidine triad (HIT) family protein